jgi:uncharacterized RDD family membrane protein YckC
MTTEQDPTHIPNAAPTGYRYAGAWVRLLALIIDGLLLSAAFFVVFIVLGGALLASYPHVAESVGDSLESNTWPAGLIRYVLTSVVMLAWFGGWQSGLGATPGMLICRLRVRDPSGVDNPSLKAAVLRNSPQVLAGFGQLTGDQGVDTLLGLVSFAVFAAIGLSIAGNAQHQGLHDRLAGGTYVVRPKEQEFEELR